MMGWCFLIPEVFNRSKIGTNYRPFLFFMNFCLWDSKFSLMQQISVAFCTVWKNHHYLYKGNRTWIECSLIFVTYARDQINLILWILQVSSQVLIKLFLAATVTGNPCSSGISAWTRAKKKSVTKSPGLGREVGNVQTSSDRESSQEIIVFVEF